MKITTIYASIQPLPMQKAAKTLPFACKNLVMI